VNKAAKSDILKIYLIYNILSFNFTVYLVTVILAINKFFNLMKQICITILVVVFMQIISSEVNAQNTTPTLDQVKLMQQFIGSWQAKSGKDTLEIWEFHQYGKAFIINVSQVVNRQKTSLYINNIAFSSKEWKFKGFALWPNGSYSTWIGAFTSDKIFKGDMVQNFNPETAYIKLQNVFKNPNEWTLTHTNKDGVKILEYKFTKVK
jgi:hypothetical protein